ncbi:type II toxin-antitoxin system RelE/ParE family toxin [Chryseobacterium oncorhynchi]|uniref:Plasmid maintenance system killer protein n=1 Tax=Chryseobacterium oncorhynchi TaxID=741074 RepID=A0A316WIC9_9FLAO|nr:type II toxin-antitoxin system RelE/ParE family toxin [Chryseobacterium oncorhynchi]PWN60046.1 plasmid maintenance system killer protein [Chryseobacterium oncorhynchi]
MIYSISHKGLKKYWTKDDSSKLPSEMIDRIREILDIIDSIEEVPQDFEPFKNLRLHPLKGKLKGFWSVDVTGNFRIIFKFESKNAFDLDLLDTH